MDIKLKKGTNRRKVQENLFCFAMIFVFVIQWAIFFVYANVNSVRLAFTQYNPVSAKHNLLPMNKLFANFAEFFGDLFSSPQGGKYFLNGAIIHLITSMICLPLNYIFAFLIYKKMRLTAAFKIIMYLPVILSGMVTTLMFKYFIEWNIADLAQNVGIKFPYVFTDRAWNMLTVCIYSFFFGQTLSLVVLGTMARVPSELIEVGNLEGISLFREFRMVVIPMIFPVLQVQCLGMFVGFFTVQGPLYALYGGAAPDNVRTFGYHLFVSVIGGDVPKSKEFMYGYTSAANLSIGLISVPIVQLTKRLFDRFDPQAEY